MTDKEFIANITTIDSEELLKTLEYIGCDGYYKDIYYPVINELKRRLKGVKYGSSN